MMDHSLAESFLKIDAEQTLDALRIYLRSLLEDSSIDGISLGLSGGIDSSLLAAIAVESIDKHCVHLAYLYDQHSSQEQYHNALTVSHWLGVEMETKSIEHAMRELGLYSSFGMRITSISGGLNRLIYNVYRRIFKESPFISSLHIGHDETSGEIPERLGFRGIIRQPEVGMNIRHIYRREVLEEQASSRGWLLIGAANRTEWQVGWFVKNGIDDLPIQPIKGLYKTQVRQLASYLKLPDEVVTQFPSPDMMKGITDEFALGMNYAKIDLILDYLDGGLTKEEITEAGCDEEEIHWVREMNRISRWKRGKHQIPAPIDGGPKGGLRIKPD